MEMRSVYLKESNFTSKKKKKNYGGDISGAESDRNLELLGRERWRADA
jgi:hypothetical protein